MRRHIAHLLLVSLAWAPSHAQAQEESAQDRADALYGAAVGLYNNGQNRDAIAKFDEAIALVPEPIFFCNRGVVKLDVGDRDGAIADLRTCRDTVAEDLRPRVDAQLTAIEVADRLTLPSARTLARMISAPTPSPEVVIRQEDDDVPLEAEPRTWSRLGLASVGLGALLGVSAVTLDLASADAHSRLEAQAKGGPGTSEADFNDALDVMRRRQLVFRGLLGGAIVTGIAGATLLVLDRPKERRTTLRLVASPSSAHMSLDVTF